MYPREPVSRYAYPPPEPDVQPPTGAPPMLNRLLAKTLDCSPDHAALTGLKADLLNLSLCVVVPGSILTALVSWFFGWWALIPAVLTLAIWAALLLFCGMNYMSDLNDSEDDESSDVPSPGSPPPYAASTP